MVCHYGWKTFKEANTDKACENTCEDCGGDLRKPTGKKYINPVIP